MMKSQHICSPFAKALRQSASRVAQYDNATSRILSRSYPSREAYVLARNNMANQAAAFAAIPR